MRIYLDHQATTPPLPGVRAALAEHLQEFWGNPHSADHAIGWEASAHLEESRDTVARAIGADADEIVFTSGATEANNIAILGCKPVAGRNRVVVSAIEHHAVLAPARELARRGYELVVVPCGADGIVDADEFAEAVDERTLLASLMFVNNEIGTVQPVREVARKCAEVGARFHVDAVQALRWQAIDVLALECSSMSFSAHKIGGPMGIGALWLDPVSATGGIRSVQFGGEQEGGLRPGTTPSFLAAGFAAAIEGLPGPSQVADWRRRTDNLWLLLSRRVPGLRLNGSATARHPGNLNILVGGCEADPLIAGLQPRIAISQGSACTSGTPEPSHVLRAMGLTANEARQSVRISTSPETTDEEGRQFVDAFAAVVSALSAGAAADM